MPEKRTIPVRDEHARHAHRPVYPGRDRGRRLLGVDAYGFAHYRAGDWVEVVRHAAVVSDGDDEAVRRDRATDRSSYDARYERGNDAPGARDTPYERADDLGDGRANDLEYGRADDLGNGRVGGRDDADPRVETDLVTVHEVPLHLVGVSLDEYLRSVGDFLDPLAEMGFRPVEGADPDRWEWVSPYAREWVAAFGDGEGPPDARDSGVGV